MFQKEIVINNHTGLHARPASELVELCSKFESDITLVKDDEEEINAKSIISILSAGIYQGTRISLQIEGPDEDTASTQVVKFLENLPD
jgi:phosphocarrier protein HPr